MRFPTVVKTNVIRAGVVHPSRSRALSMYGEPPEAAFKLEIVLSGTTLNFNLYAAAVAARWDQKTPLNAKITVQEGAIVGSNSTSAYALDTGTGFPSGSRLSLINNGYIVGRGGDGASEPGSFESQKNGGNGGPALSVQSQTSIKNYGTIGGGGGGGGHSASVTNRVAGGGGAGYPAGVGGTIDGSTVGYPGSLTTGGNGSSGSDPNKGKGGNLGEKGATANSTSDRSGAGGAAVVGNSNITWVSTGTRLGSIS